MPFDAAQTRPTCRPGERLVAGKVYVFDADLRGLDVAHAAVQSAPADLTGLDYEELTTLLIAARTVLSAPRSSFLALPYRLDFAAAAKVEQIAAEERASRPEYRRTYCPEAA